MRDTIITTLKTIERDAGVRILYACEAGSRAWGMASEESDYDVHFIYARPSVDYLRLDAPRDVIERLDGLLDCAGWDIFKALRLLRKSNPPLLEWLGSPVIYREASPAIAALRELAQASFSEAALFYHYRHMAGGNYRQYIAGKNLVLTKKYLYAARPLVALLYLEQYGALPPVGFQETLDYVTVDPVIRAVISDLIARKTAGDELGMGAPSSLLNGWIEARLAQWSVVSGRDASQAMTASLNTILASVLAEENA